MKRVLPIIVVTLFLAGIFIVPAGVSNTPARLQETTLLNDVTLEQDAELSWLPTDTTIRVALYNETNSTTPNYAIGNMNTNYTFIYNLFIGAGYQVDRLTFQDILDHKLNTKNYDVLVLADNCPRENISDLTREFWLGGGGILSFDSSASYLGWAGILPREDEGTGNGEGTYWDYVVENDANITARHPVTQSYALGTTLAIDTSLDYAQYDKTALDGTSIGSDITYLAVARYGPDWFQAVAVDPTDMGGKVVHIGVPIDPWSAPWEDMMIDAVEWLCPRPKGRVLFDLTHQPYYAVDDFDSAYAYNGGTTHETFRNDIVANGHTFDKLYPSASGNFTADKIAPYDVLIVNLPYLNFTASEVSTVTSWINSGGSLLVIGDVPTTQRDNLNYLLSGTNFNFNDTTGSNSLFQVDEHALHEDASTVSVLSPESIKYPAPITPVWEDALGRVIIAVDEQSEGRIAVVGDVALLRENAIGTDDNQQVGINLINWLTAGDVLVFAFETGPNDPNPYRGPVASAMNSLGIPFLLTSSLEYFNLSLVTEEWELVVFDHQNAIGYLETYSSRVLDYMMAGGKIITSSWEMDTDTYPANKPLWDYLGVSYAGNNFGSPPTIHIWDSAHPVFTTPTDYGADNLTTTHDYVGIDCANLTVHANGTAIAGLGKIQSTTNASIVLGANGRAITNGMGLTGYLDDTDDSTYSDCIEIWRSEIAYLMRPVIDSPVDMVVEYGTAGATLTWTPTSDRPYNYEILRNGGLLTDFPWDGGPISVLLDNYLIGTYTFEITVWDTSGSIATDTVVVVVEDTTAPAFGDAPDNNYYDEGTAHFYMNWSFSELNPDSWVL
ncbi:MAG: hypothetical protein ACW98Y_14290, partial [Candidatus Thorarchaeota archaeon]